MRNSSPKIAKTAFLAFIMEDLLKVFWCRRLCTSVCQLFETSMQVTRLYVYGSWCYLG